MASEVQDASNPVTQPSSADGSESDRAVQVASSEQGVKLLTDPRVRRGDI